MADGPDMDHVADDLEDNHILKPGQDNSPNIFIAEPCFQPRGAVRVGRDSSQRGIDGRKEFPPEPVAVTLIPENRRSQFTFGFRMELQLHADLGLANSVSISARTSDQSRMTV